MELKWHWLEGRIPHADSRCVHCTTKMYRMPPTIASTLHPTIVGYAGALAWIPSALFGVMRIPSAFRGRVYDELNVNGDLTVEIPCGRTSSGTRGERALVNA